MSSVSTESGYWHRPLSTASSIRVMLLEPATRQSDPIRFILEEISLDQPIPSRLQYEALSYCWGSKVKDCPLFCDGETIRVTTNCDQAIRALRYKNKTRTLWVDSVCLNQYDIGERNRHALIMAQIYYNAHKTLIWLGESKPLDAKLFRRMRVMSRLFSSLGRYADRKQLEFDASIKWGAPWTDMFFDLCSHPWFKRVWTNQELALSRSPWVVRGEQMISWKSFTSCGQLFRALTYEDEQEKMLLKYDQCKQRKILRDIAWNSLDTIVTNDQIARQVFLSSCRNSTRDVRDHVFGIHALASGLGIHFHPPDYEDGAAIVFEEATLSMIRFQQSLDFLAFSNTPKSPALKLPSWVPDWSYPQHIETYEASVFKTRIQESKLAFQPDCLESWRPGKLASSGFVIDTLQSFSVQMPSLDSSSAKLYDVAKLLCLCYWLRFLRESGSFPVLHYFQGQPTDEDIYDALWQVLGTSTELRRMQFDKGLQDFSEPSRHNIFSALSWAKNLPSRENSPELPGDSINSRRRMKICSKLWRDQTVGFSETIHRAVQGCALFLTGEGLIGFTPVAARQGDVLAALHGAPHLAVLRKMNGGTFSFVGFAHVPLAMTGEAWEAKLKGPRETFELI